MIIYCWTHFIIFLPIAISHVVSFNVFFGGQQTSATEMLSWLSDIWNPPKQYSPVKTYQVQKWKTASSSDVTYEIHVGLRRSSIVSVMRHLVL